MAVRVFPVLGVAVSLPGPLVSLLTLGAWCLASARAEVSPPLSVEAYVLYASLSLYIRREPQCCSLDASSTT